MALPFWPEEVPLCPIDGSMQIIETAPAPLRTEMNAGTTRVRRKYTLRIARMNFMLWLSNDQADAFQVFHDETLSDGAARFQAHLPFRAKLLTQTCQFADSPSYTPVGATRQRVSVSLLVENLGTGALYVPEPPEEPEPPDYTPSLDFSNPLNSGYVALI